MIYVYDLQYEETPYTIFTSSMNIFYAVYDRRCEIVIYRYVATTVLSISLLCGRSPIPFCLLNEMASWLMKTNGQMNPLVKL